MTTIKADPAELRRLAHGLRNSASHLRQLGGQAIGAAASANSPAAAGTIAEAASFATGAHASELRTGVLATGTERVADLFEAADRGGGWFSGPVLLLAGRWGMFGRDTLLKAQNAYKNVPHSARPKAWHRFGRELAQGRGPRARYWGFNDARKALNAWGRSRWQTLTHPKTSLIKFRDQGVQAVTKLSKNTSFLRRVKPLTKFGGNLANKVLRPLHIVDSYRNSKAGSPVGKATSVFFSTVLTKNPYVYGADLLSGGQLSTGVDGVVSTIFAVGDSDRLSEMLHANANGENGLAMQAIEFVGDDILAEGIYNGWAWITNGH